MPGILVSARTKSKVSAPRYLGIAVPLEAAPLFGAAEAEVVEIAYQGRGIGQKGIAPCRRAAALKVGCTNCI